MDRPCMWGRERFLHWFSALPRFALLERVTGVRWRTWGLTDPANPGVPSRTRGYYGPRAGELGFLFVLPPIGYLRTIGGIRTGRDLKTPGGFRSRYRARGAGRLLQKT